MLPPAFAKMLQPGDSLALFWRHRFALLAHRSRLLNGSHTAVPVKLLPPRRSNLRNGHPAGFRCRA